MKVVVIHSGGLDSSVLVLDLKRQGAEVVSLGVNYGQRHQKELLYGDELCRLEGVRRHMADLRAIAQLLGGSSQTDANIPVPEGRYDEESMKVTVVPNRNMIMLSVAVGFAVSLKFDAVAFAAHAGDHTIYPDCRADFTTALSKAVRMCDWHQVELLSPYVGKTKADIVSIGRSFPHIFPLTWSCYKGRLDHCGRCGTCIERREAFHLAGVGDPTVYAPDAPSVEELLKKDWKL